MVWRPSTNILRPDPHGSTGAGYPGATRANLTWPPCALYGGGDYSIDFDGLLAPGELIASYGFDAGDAAERGWTNLFGTIVTAWLRWTKPGPQSVTVCAVTDQGNSHQVEASITISSRPTLFPVQFPPPPQNPAAPLTGAMMDDWLRSLPTDPASAGNGWFNNAGIPTRLGEIA